MTPADIEYIFHAYLHEHKNEFTYSRVPITVPEFKTDNQGMLRSIARKMASKFGRFDVHNQYTMPAIDSGLRRFLKAEGCLG